MLSIQQLIKALRKLQNSGGNCGDLVKSIKHVVAASATEAASGATITTLSPAAAMATSLLSAHYASNNVTSAALLKQQQKHEQYEQHEQQQQQQQLKITNSSQQTEVDCRTSQTAKVSLILHLNENSSTTAKTAALTATTFKSTSSPSSAITTASAAATKTNATTTQDSNIINSSTTTTLHHLHRSQQIQNFYQQQLHHFHTQHNQSLYAKQKQTQANAMSSLAAEPLTLSNNKQDDCHNGVTSSTSTDAVNVQDENSASASGTSSEKPCFNTGLGEILQFMELIGNLKHTKRTGWVLRDVNDCESISGHMYRMSMMTFLLDGTEGLNQIRCMELALVHDLAESLVGDITPFCGISKEEKRAMEFKAMEDICKLIEPRGKRIMELFEEYEHGQSAESRFVKDLDRLDMVMQAFEYEKRDNCLLKHQEFFDSTAGKFNHPFVKKLVDEIYEQRQVLAKAKGATPPPVVHVPNMDLPARAAETNGHAAAAATSSSSSSS